MDNFDLILNRYAELTIRLGVNIQPGQTLVINAPLFSVDLVRKLASIAYEAGAKNVHVEWADEDLSLIKYQGAPDEAFLEYPEWKAQGFEEMARNGAAFLSIYSPNPDLFKDVNPERIANANKTAAKALLPYRTYLTNFDVSWSMIAFPSPAWATKVFPNLSESEAVEKLWQYIFESTRVTEEDAVEAWRRHVENLTTKANYLNNARFHKLHYMADGTNLSIELPSEHEWISAENKNLSGTPFVANIPTEEVFTMPLRTGVNGVVKSTLPLNYNGTLVEGLSFTFKDGKVVDFQASSGYEAVKKLLDTDEGARYLGEVALVPHHSPISNLNTIFYNTLFDENASCHLAVGAAYPITLRGGNKMTRDELNSHGANHSLTHVDFMIGSADLSIDGETRDGKRIAIFRNGNWAI